MKGKEDHSGISDTLPSRVWHRPVHDGPSNFLQLFVEFRLSGCFAVFTRMSMLQSIRRSGKLVGSIRAISQAASTQLSVLLLFSRHVLCPFRLSMSRWQLSLLFHRRFCSNGFVQYSGEAVCRFFCKWNGDTAKCRLWELWFLPLLFDGKFFRRGHLSYCRWRSGSVSVRFVGLWIDRARLLPENLVMMWMLLVGIFVQLYVLLLECNCLVKGRPQPCSCLCLPGNEVWTLWRSSSHAEGE